MSAENGFSNSVTVSLQDNDDLRTEDQKNSDYNSSNTAAKLGGDNQDFNVDVRPSQNMNGVLSVDSSAKLLSNSAAACPVATSLDSLDLSSDESKLCVEHSIQLDWFCNTDGKIICSLCATVGACNGHIVTQLTNQATIIRNHLVDVCERMQLQAQRIERFINQTLTAKEKALQVEASSARERVLAQINAVREALEGEEQCLLESIQREEERVEQCLLTQRAHWNQALETLTNARTSLVHTLTHSQDAQIVNSNQEISDRTEEAEGVGDPKDTEQLSLNRECSNSKLILGLWASAILLGPSAHRSPNLHFDKRTVSPLLSLSTDERTLTFLPKRLRQALPDDPARFDSWPNALGSISISSGTHRWVLDVGQSAAYKVGVCYTTLERKGSGNSARLGYNEKSWVLSHYEGNFSFCHAGKNVSIRVVKSPTRLGILLDWPSQTLLFYDPESCCVLHTVRHTFTQPLLPACAVADQSVTLLN
ncbi:B box and SPRY domain-containing protein [Chanos chanos]|uniref:B box and SPRY domain-containing protein n=1 Tax=Chanos chanos TaxID=29144 RepID=A0A6J2UYL6_CHACN|nr:B box and SPRY domain-containing protein [Chanos chanos]